MTIQCHNLFSVIVCFVSTDADVCIDRRGCLHRPTRMSASTDADVCIDRCELRTCYFYFSTPSSLPTLMKAAIALSSCSRV